MSVSLPPIAVYARRRLSELHFVAVDAYVPQNLQILPPPLNEVHDMPGAGA